MFTRTTHKQRLGATVITSNIAAGVTALRSVSCTHRHHLTLLVLRLILKENPELGKRPGMQTAHAFTFACLNAFSYVCEIFDNDRGAWRNIGQNAFAENMITIASEALCAPREASKTAFCRLRTIRLQSATQMMTAVFDLPPSLPTVKTAVRRDSRTANAQVNSQGTAVIDKQGIIELEYDMQNEPPLAIDEISRGDFVSDQRNCVIRNLESNLLTAFNGGKRNSLFRPVHLESVSIESRRTECRGRTTNFSPFFVERNGRSDSFGGFLSGLNVKIRDKIRKQNLTISVGDAM